MTEDDVSALVDYLAGHPTAGDAIRELADAASSAGSAAAKASRAVIAPSRFIPNVVDRDLSASSWPGLSRPSTSLIQLGLQALDARHKAGHDESVIP
ncbi:MAG TPA: hypothetical protein VIH40_08255, partial [Xanthobacteraceae bacterium]